MIEKLRECLDNNGTCAILTTDLFQASTGYLMTLLQKPQAYSFDFPLLTIIDLYLKDTYRENASPCISIKIDFVLPTLLFLTLVFGRVVLYGNVAFFIVVDINKKRYSRFLNKSFRFPGNLFQS